MGSRPATLDARLARRGRAARAAASPAGSRRGAAGAGRLRAAEPFEGRQPDRVAGAVVVAEARDALGEELDPARRGVERVRLRVGAEGRQQHAVLRGSGRRAVPASRSSSRLGSAKPASPARWRAPSQRWRSQSSASRPSVKAAPTPSRRRSPPRWRSRRAPRPPAGPPARMATISGSQWVIEMSSRSSRRRGGEDDVGVARHRGPPDLVDDDGLGAAERLDQPVEILVVVERVAARPVDEPQVRVAPARAVEVVLRRRDRAAHPRCARPGSPRRPGSRPAAARELERAHRLPMPFSEA